MDNAEHNNKGKILRILRAINYWHLLLIITFSELITALMNTLQSIIWWGHISYELLQIGAVDAFAASVLVGTPILHIYTRYNEKLRDYRRQLEAVVAEKTSELTVAVDSLKHEIAERRLIENALAESEERLRGIFEQSEDSLFLISPDTCEILDVNPAASDLFGYTKEDFLSRGLRLIFDSGDFESCATSICNACPVNGLRIEQLPGRKKDGATITLSAHGKLIMLKQHDVLFCSFRNMTEKIRLREESRLIQSKLIQTNKMASLGMLVSGIAHEINNPNNFIMVNSQVVSDAWKDALHMLNEYHREHGDFSLGGIPYSELRYIMPRLLTSIAEGSGRIRDIVANLKDFTRQDRSSADNPVDINEIIKSSLMIIDSQIKKHTDCFRTMALTDLPPVRGSRQQLEQVIINLVMNSLQSLQGKDREVSITGRYAPDTDSVIIEIKDQGTGMTQDILDHITEPFFSTRIREGGTGLGLSISESIIKEHQGSLKFSSEPGIGTTAVIRLPVYHLSAEGN